MPRFSQHTVNCWGMLSCKPWIHGLDPAEEKGSDAACLSMLTAPAALQRFRRVVWKSIMVAECCVWFSLRLPEGLARACVQTKILPLLV